MGKGENTENIFTAIQAIYNNVKACVKSPDGISDKFICTVGLRQGSPLSPILFSLFINEMYNEFKSSNVRGIQLFPDLTEIFLLMFADDIGLISDTVTGLQKQPNILHEYCRDFKLKVNINKTKIMVFKRGGGLSKKEHWSYGGILLEVVKGFTYVVIYFTHRLSFFKMAESSTLKAKKVLNYLFSSFSKLSVLPAKTFFKIFDSKIYPVMLYGAELWGLQFMHCVEQLQIYACKCLLSVRTNSCNLSILGDTSRFPVQIMSSKRCIKYWLCILKMPRTRYVKLCYEMLLHLDNLGYSNWVTAVRLNLSSNGYGYIWENQHVDNENVFCITTHNALRTNTFKNGGEVVLIILNYQIIMAIKNFFAVNRT